MHKCEHCGVDLPGRQQRCPLCQNTPSGVPDGSEGRFPHIPDIRWTVSRTLVMWIAFISVCAVAVCITLNIIIPAAGWWSLFVIAGIASLWIDFTLMIIKRRNLPKNILWQVIIISAIALIWDLITGFRGWSLDFVLPIISSCAMVAMMTVAKSRRLDIQDYILYLIIDCILGFVCFILILTSAVKIVIPCAICFGISVIFLAFLLFFEGKALWAEFQRRLHL